MTNINFVAGLLIFVIFSVVVVYRVFSVNTAGSFFVAFLSSGFACYFGFFSNFVAGLLIFFIFSVIVIYLVFCAVNTSGSFFVAFLSGFAVYFGFFSNFTTFIFFTSICLFYIGLVFQASCSISLFFFSCVHCIVIFVRFVLASQLYVYIFTEVFTEFATTLVVSSANSVDVMAIFTGVYWAVSPGFSRVYVPI